MKHLLLVLSLVSTTALASGFRIDTQDAAAVGLGSAVTALVDNPSSNFYNPAGLLIGKGVAVSGGINLIVPQLRYADSQGSVTAANVGVSTPFNLFLQVGLHERWAVGLGITTPFGARGDWPDDWAGRFKARQSSLQAFSINPNVAFKLNPRVYVAGGVNVTRSTVFISRALDFVDSEGAVSLGGGAWGVSFNLGLKIEVVRQRLWFGATLRTSTSLDFAGRAHFENVPTEFSSRLHDQAIKSSFDLPTTASFGFGFLATDRLRLAIDATWVNWRGFRALTIEFENPDLTVPLQKQWNDSVSFALGGEYTVGAGVKARLGLVYDPTPTPVQTLTPDLPDATRVKICAGVGYAHDSGFFADLGFQFVVLVPQQSIAPGFEGTYSGTAQVVALSLGYKF